MFQILFNEEIMRENEGKERDFRLKLAFSTWKEKDEGKGAESKKGNHSPFFL